MMHRNECESTRRKTFFVAKLTTKHQSHLKKVFCWLRSSFYLSCSTRNLEGSGTRLSAGLPFLTHFELEPHSVRTEVGRRENKTSGRDFHNRK